jgi:hypothetical protein
MTMFRKKLPNPARDRFLEVAKSHLGYKTRPSGLSDFAAQTGYSGHAIPWSGAFIDVVARDSNIVMPSCVYTPSGLGEFAARRRVVSEPEPGDIVFYVFPTTDQFSMPHVGIVTDVIDYNSTGVFIAIEAQVASGLPRASTDRTGIFERHRWKYDVMAFARPEFEHRPGLEEKMQTGIVFVNERLVRPGKKNSDVQTVQNALVEVAGLTDFSAGAFDATTQRAYSRWQRQIGYVYPDCTGVPDKRSLKVLGDRTGRFRLKTDSEES